MAVFAAAERQGELMDATTDPLVAGFLFVIGLFLAAFVILWSV